MSSELGKCGLNPLLAIINPLQRLFTRRNVKFPIPRTRQKEMIEIARALNNGSYKPVIDREYLFNQISEAYNYVHSGKKVGTVILKI